MSTTTPPSSPAATVESWPAVFAMLLARRDLTSDMATSAMDQVIRGHASPAQLAAFVIAPRAKGETAAEIDGLVAALLRAATPIAVPGPTIDIAGTGGDRTNAVNISTMAAIVVATTGATVIKHGGRAAIAIAAGITFLFAPTVHPGMRHAGPVRCELGVPTVFNVLGPLINPANPNHRLLGVADARLLPIIADVLRARRATALVVRGPAEEPSRR